MMDPIDKKKIIKNLGYLSENTKNLRKLGTGLVEREILTPSELQNLMKENDEYSRNSELYLTLMNKGPEAFKNLLVSLTLSGNEDIYLHIIGESKVSSKASTMQRPELFNNPLPHSHSFSMETVETEESVPSKHQTSFLVEQTKNKNSTDVSLGKPFEHKYGGDLEDDNAFPEFFDHSKTQRNYNPDLSIYKLIGSKGNLIKFVPTIISNKNAVLITRLNLEHAEIDANGFPESLSFCINLKSIKLAEVKIAGKFQSRVTLPNLQEFEYSEVKQFRFIFQLTTGVKNINLKSILFFDKQSEQSWDLEHVWGLKVNLKVAFAGATLLALNHDTEEFISSLPQSESILANVNESLKVLALCNCQLTYTPTMPSSLRNVNLRNVQVENLQALIRSCEYLEELRVSTATGGGTIIDLSDLPKSLKVLHLHEALINYHPDVCYTFELDILSLDNCILSSELVSNFDQIFQVKKVMIEGRHPNRPTYTLLKNILKCDAEFIYCWGLNRGAEDSKADQEIVSEMCQLLEQAAIQEDVTDFILERDEFKVWTGKKIKFEEINMLRFTFLARDKFWSQEAAMKWSIHY